MNEFNEGLLDLLKKGTCPFTCIKEICDILDDNDYKRLSERETWNLDYDKYYVVRNDASLIAFNIPQKIKKQFNIICTHDDTPAFTIKPNPDYYENGYLKLNIAPYGGILNYGFMDRPLSIAGRILYKNNNVIRKEIIDIKDNVAIIPSIAIHQNDKANTNLELNSEIDLMPIISLDKDYSLKKLLEEKLKTSDEVYDFDLFLYNTEEPTIINKDFIASPRIDNLTCTYAALKAFIDNFNEGINILAIFNSEEIGSNTYEGADSNFLIDTLKRICAKVELDLTEALANSLIISADNTHARHPNHDELSDHTNTPILNDGILITKEMNGTTNGITSAIFKKICNDNDIRWNYYTSRNDFSGGATQAGASLKHLSINSLDIALPMLAMHSSLEVIGINDTYLLYKAMREFYKVKYKLEDKRIVFK